MLMTRPIGLLLVLLAMAFYSGCGGSNAPGTTPGHGHLQDSPASQWPSVLPVDAVQPWEVVDESGKVNSGINADSQFLAGVEYTVASATGVSDNSEAARISTGDVGSGQLSYAMYRVLMGGEQPGAVSFDVNPGVMSNGQTSGYFIGLANYGKGCWDWHGPFTDNHVRLSTAGNGDLLTDLGNHFACVLAYNGAVIDVVGVGANPIAAGDTEAPPMPNGVYALPVNGGLEVKWDDVIAGDLAGYRVYYAAKEFDANTNNGVHQVEYLVGQSSHLLTGLTATTYVRISAVDLSGNESAWSETVIRTPYTGNSLEMHLATSTASGLHSEPIALTATGADSYAWDLDGDGVFEISHDTTGVQLADTTHTGIIRPSVRGATEDGSGVACAAVSLLIAANSRPVAYVTAAPTTGAAPLLVTFTGSGVDDDGEVASYSWDFDGNGVYDWTQSEFYGTMNFTYQTPGLYNAKLRVEDDLGSWDVDTVAILVTDGANNPPTADLQADGTTGNAPFMVNFDASASSDSDGSIVEYQWDWEGDGVYEGTSYSPAISHTFNETGEYQTTVRVVDDDGAADTAEVSVTVNFEFPPGMTFVKIQPGTFMMGSPESEVGRWEVEGPQHEVTLTRECWIGAHEVTQSLYEDVMGDNPSHFEGDNLPVEMVSWDDCQDFIHLLNIREHFAGRVPLGWEYRLPTEAEWEYAARAGTTTAYSFGEDPAPLSDYTWWWSNSGGTTHEVGTKLPNPWGLYDVHGNVYEWCSDWYSDYTSEAQTDPSGPETGTYRVFRSSSYRYEPLSYRSAFRWRYTPTSKQTFLGFRLAVSRVWE